MGTKETALGIASALADVEASADSTEMATNLDVLHRKLRRGMYEHRDLLGLSADDLAEIDNLGPQRRGGEPKDPDYTGDDGEG